MLAHLSTHAVDEYVACEERDRSRKEAEGDAPGAAPGCECFLDQLEGDGADQDAAAERHHHPEGAFADAKPKRYDAAEDQRRSREEAPP